MGLLDRILFNILTERAGDYLKINREQLKVGLLSGEIVLNNVEIKVEALKELLSNLPVTIKSAKVATLRAKIPLNELSSKPVKISLTGMALRGVEKEDRNELIHYIYHPRH